VTNSPASSRAWRFGPFLLDNRAGELRRGGELVKLQEKPRRLLEVLLSRPGEVVSREALWQALWPDAHVDFDNGLHNAVSRLRAALGDHQALVETAGRRGYRFAGDVVAVAANRVPALVVLPLQWLGATPEPWFADGLSEALIAELARRPDLHVISWTTAQRYARERPPLAELARRLGVDLALEGSVAKDGDRVRVAVRLIDAEADVAVWSAAYERDVEDVLALQAHVARCVLAEMPLPAELPPGPARPRRVDAAVLDAYFKGRYHWNHRTEVGLRRGIEMFERALAGDPGFAPAHAGIADCYNSLSTVVLGSPPGEMRPLAIAAARRALSLDPQLAEGHASLGYACFHDCSWPEAEHALARALALRPGYAEAHAWSAHLHCARGRHEEAEAAARRAVALEPLSIYVRATLGFVLYVAGRLGEARAACESGLEIEDSPIPRLFLGFVLMAEGNGPDAVKAVERAVALTGRSASMLGWLAGALAVAGRRDEADVVRRELRARAAAGYVPPAALAFAAFAVGDEDEAYDRLGDAVTERANVVAYLGVIPYFDRERSDPRYRELLRRLALA
jgi:TolB-like protein/Flp pilus assembly protein TadD